MGKIQILTREQTIILDEIGRNKYLQEHFYFSGGTALSSIYLQHRFSDDLDFFSRKKLDNEVVFSIVEEWSKKYNFTIQARFIEVVYRFQLVFSQSNILRVDFSYYPYRQIEKPQVKNGIVFDSLVDIAINKLLTISQRTEIKDFVDLYFLLQQFSLWDLQEGVRIKFRMEQEPILLAADFLKVEDFKTLPKMIKPLTLETLKKFFRTRAKDLGLTAVK